MVPEPVYLYHIENRGVREPLAALLYIIVSGNYAGSHVMGVFNTCPTIPSTVSSRAFRTSTAAC